ncbi:MAG TPA: gamma-glutamyl-gamma-aminobutyrate hydrolase family protein, partial [Candidatus Cloacimonas sp.]|nr:gamma-glutamyl-gamma-aminobutyrate hydrolase family protein [Candidatus Cloacimonas sp.]
DLCNLVDANSTEFNEETLAPVIHLIKDQVYQKRIGGSMRLGAYDCHLDKGSKAYQAYQTETISERHRHRYEFNNDYREIIQKAGLKISGLSPDNYLVEIVEYPDLDFFIAVQFHPEFKSRPTNPHPLFREFIKAASLKKP